MYVPTLLKKVPAPVATEKLSPLAALAPEKVGARSYQPLLFSKARQIRENFDRSDSSHKE